MHQLRDADVPRTRDASPQTQSASALTAAPRQGFVIRGPCSAVIATYLRLAGSFANRSLGVSSGHGPLNLGLLDDFIRPQQQRRRDRQAERLGGFEV
jgi:hypothetical protein